MGGMQEEHAPWPTRPARARLTTFLAATEAEVQEAQRLRYRVFAEEMGADLPERDRGLDRDDFDPWCDHLLVRDDETGEVVGTYRILPGSRASRLGRFYSESEFNLHGVRALPGLVEVGRACVHPDYRHGGVISLLWAGLMTYLAAHDHAHVIGCASIPVTDGGRAAASICRELLTRHLSPAAWRVRPHVPFAFETLGYDPTTPLPVLIKGYVRLGAYACGPPAWDPHFRTADILLLLPLAEVNPRYVRRLSRAA